jgi:hypothetical protein
MVTSKKSSSDLNFYILINADFVFHRMLDRSRLELKGPRPRTQTHHCSGFCRQVDQVERRVVVKGVCHRLPGCVPALAGHLLGGSHRRQDQEPGRGPGYSCGIIEQE